MLKKMFERPVALKSRASKIFRAVSFVPLFVFGSFSSLQAETTLSTLTALPTKHALAQSYIKHFIEPLNAQGKGIVKINLLGGPEVTPAKRAPQAMQRGVVDILWIPAAYVAGIVPEAQAMMLQTVGIEQLRSGSGFSTFEKVFSERLQSKLLAWAETGPGSGYYLYTKPEPKMKDGVVDLTGLTMRTTGAYRPIQEALNATTVAIPSGDVPTGLERGVVHGFGWPTVGLGSIGLAELIKYRVEPKFYNLANVVLISNEKWSSLPAEARKIIGKVAKEYELASVQYMIDQNKADIDVANKAGVKPLVMSGEDGKKYLRIAEDAMWEVVAKKVDSAEARRLRDVISR